MEYLAMAKRWSYEWDREVLRRLYEDERKTVEEIGLILGRASKLVNKWCKKLGIQMRPRGQKFGPEHKGWKGGRRVDKDGYILTYAPDHPAAHPRAKTVREHRLVMEKVLGRYLLPEEVVHHKDEDKQNNHPDNLELFATNRDHLAETLKGKVPNWTPEGRARMLLGVRRPRQQTSTRTSSTPDDCV